MEWLINKIKQPYLLSLSIPLVSAQGSPFSDENFSRIVEHLPGIGWFAGLGLLTVCLIFLILPLVIAILLCIWIYKDAEERGKEGNTMGYPTYHSSDSLQYIWYNIHCNIMACRSSTFT